MMDFITTIAIPTTTEEPRFQEEILADMNLGVTTFMFCIISCQILGSISNVFCIYIVCRIKKSLITRRRPKILMANICLTDTSLIIVSIVPRFIILALMVDQYSRTAHVIHSIRAYLENLCLYVEAITMAVIACDRYYALTKVYHNPFDNIAVRKILIAAWAVSMVLAAPFAITNDMDYYNYTNSQIICINDKEYFGSLGSNFTLIYTSRLVSMLIEFIAPTLLVVWFYGRIIFYMVDAYIKTVRGVHQTAFCGQRCVITKRLLVVLFIFIVKNIAYVLITDRLDRVLIKEKNLDKCSTGIGRDGWIFYVEIYRITTSLSSLIYFWFSTDFRAECKQVLWNSKGTRSRTSSREPMVTTI